MSKEMEVFEDSYSHQFIVTNGINLHVVLAGPEEGEMVIFLHGFPEFWYGWRGQIEFFAEKGYSVVVSDQRGYNLSDKPRRIRDYGIGPAIVEIWLVLSASTLGQYSLPILLVSTLGEPLHLSI